MFKFSFSDMEILEVCVNEGSKKYIYVNFYKRLPN
jgi:hypothetical protein